MLKNILLSSTFKCKQDPLGIVALPLTILVIGLGLEVTNFPEGGVSLGGYFPLEIETSMVETFLVLPSGDCTCSDPIFTGPIL